MRGTERAKMMSFGVVHAGIENDGRAANLTRVLVSPFHIRGQQRAPKANLAYDDTRLWEFDSGLTGRDWIPIKLLEGSIQFVNSIPNEKWLYRVLSG
jgi:hypothetical protein